MAARVKQMQQGAPLTPGFPPPMMGEGMVKPPHGMSLAARPQRPPHPTAPGRDKFGRIMPIPQAKPAKAVAAKVSAQKAAEKAAQSFSQLLASANRGQGRVPQAPSIAQAQPALNPAQKQWSP